MFLLNFPLARYPLPATIPRTSLLPPTAKQRMRGSFSSTRRAASTNWGLSSTSPESGYGSDHNLVLPDSQHRRVCSRSSSDRENSPIDAIRSTCSLTDSLAPAPVGAVPTTAFPRLVPEKTWDGSSLLHPRPVECISTCTARRSRCSSPPRGPYHSRRTLWKTTQASKTTPAATDGSNIKFSSVTESFLSSAQSPEERCSDTSRTDPAMQSTLPTEPRADRSQHAKPTVSQAYP